MLYKKEEQDMSGSGGDFVLNKANAWIAYTDEEAEKSAVERGVRPRPQKIKEEIDERGAFVRQPNRFNTPFGEEASQLKAEAGKYRLFWAKGCHWSNRAAIVRELLGLEEAISINLLAATGETNKYGWGFPDEENHEDHVNYFETAFKPFQDKNAPDLYPVELRKEIDDFNDWLFPNINNANYYRNLGPLKKRVVDYENIWAYARDLYEIPAFRNNTYFRDFAKDKGGNKKLFSSFNGRFADKIDYEAFWSTPQNRRELSKTPDEKFLRA